MSWRAFELTYPALRKLKSQEKSVDEYEGRNRDRSHLSMSNILEKF